MKKKKWKKPHLIVLVRGNPAEAILARCKRDNQTAALSISATGSIGDCMGILGIESCEKCNTLTDS
ncbi:MAG: hypothetical protein V1674_03925 [Candidatus Omnitrophota bacterium]